MYAHRIVLTLPTALPHPGPDAKGLLRELDRFAAKDIVYRLVYVPLLGEIIDAYEVTFKTPGTGDVATYLENTVVGIKVYIQDSLRLKKPEPIDEEEADAGEE